LDDHRDLRVNLDSLRQFVADRRKRFLDRVNQDFIDPRDYLEFEALRASPVLSVADREELWTAGRKLAGKLQDITQKFDDKDDQAGSGPTPVSDLEPERKLRRTMFGIDLFKLESAGEAKFLQVKLGQAQGGGAKEWEDLGVSFRDAYFKKLPAELEQ